MSFTFDKTPDHRSDNSYKWEQPEGRNDVLGLGTADLDFDCAPCIRDALLPIALENSYNYRKKSVQYFEAVEKWYLDRYDLKISRDWLYNVPSTIGSIRIALALWGKGKKVIMQSPYFGPLKNAITGAGCELITNSMKVVNNRYEIDFDDFEEKVKNERPALFLMVNPHNPTGRIFSRDELERLTDICSRYGVIILSDEVHALVCYEGKKHIPILAVNETAKHISVQIMSMSKGYNIMSLPHAIITIADDGLRSAWLKEITPYSFGYATNPFSIAAVTAVLTNDGNWLKSLNEYLTENRDMVMAFIDEHIPNVTAYKPEGGYLIWIDCRKLNIPQPPEEFFLEKAGLSTFGGEEFGPDGNGFIRINIGLSKDKLLEALKRLARVVDSICE